MNNNRVTKRLPKMSIDLANYDDDPHDMDLTLHFKPKNYNLAYSYSPDNMDDIVRFAKLTDEYFDKCIEKEKAPNTLGLCKHLGIYTDNFYKYLNGTYSRGDQKGLKHYQDICKAAHQAFGAGLIEGGLNKTYNSQVAMMILGAKYGYGKTDTLNVNLSVTKDTSTMTDEELTAELAALRLKRASIEVEYTELDDPDTD